MFFPLGFIEEYFLNPIQYGTGYNIVNTLTYAVLLILALFMIKWVFEKLNINMDRKLWLDLVPFVFFGGVLRALEDSAYLPHHWLFITPIIYILIFVIAFSFILLEKYSKKPVTRYAGISLLAVFGSQAIVLGRNWQAFILTLGIAFGIIVLLYYVFKFLKVKLLNKNSRENIFVLFGHILDSVSSVVAISFLCVAGVGYTEQHVLPSALFGFLPVVAFIPIKIAIISGVLYIIDKEAKGRWTWLLKFTIFTLGAAPGTRNLVTALLNSNFC